MIKNKYYIGQRVRVVATTNEFEIDCICVRPALGKVQYTGLYLAGYFYEDELEPLPEKKKIVLWQWICKFKDSFYYENWGSETLYTENKDYIKTGATKEVEIPHE